MLDYGAITYSDICLSERSGVAKTYGKGIMQSTRPFSIFGNSDAMKLTTAQIYWPKSENCIHGRGVLPEDGTKTVSESYEKDVEISSAITKLFE
jgi:C-terminal processing protease CtpA/Prc